jgi:hypothetical protein
MLLAPTAASVAPKSKFSTVIPMVSPLTVIAGPFFGSTRARAVAEGTHVAQSNAPYTARPSVDASTAMGSLYPVPLSQTKTREAPSLAASIPRPIVWNGAARVPLPVMSLPPGETNTP